jgi:hypothetical protein
MKEGGDGTLNGEHVGFSIEVAQKRPYWLRLIARDKPGHRSSTTRYIDELLRVHYP